MATLNTTAPSTPPSPKNIFKNPLPQKEKVEEKRREYFRNKNYKKGSVYLGVAAVFLVAYSIFFFYPQVKAYVMAPRELQAMEQKIGEYQNVILPQLESERIVHKAAYDAELDSVENAIDRVFPGTVDKLGVVKRLENFATALNTQSPPFEFNSMSFGEPEQRDGYTILPISTSIHASQANFDRFIQLVELSGRLDQDIKVRLMEISSVNIRYRGTDPRTGEDKGVDFSVKLNAYSR